jgi:putrescine transport system permease protein
MTIVGRTISSSLGWLARHPILRRHGRTLVVGVPHTWLLVFLLLPFIIVVKVSLSRAGLVGFEDLVTFEHGVPRLAADGGSYHALLDDPLYLRTYLASLRYAALTTLACLIVGYPFAYFMARARASLQPALLMLVMLPFWTSFLLRVYAWKGLLVEGGWVARVLTALHVGDVLAAAGLVPAPGHYMNTPFSLVLGMTYTYLPFMVLPLYATLARLDVRLLEAAADLGATPWTAFVKVTVPLSRPGLVAGSMLVFIPCVGEYVVPELLGGPDTLMLGRLLWDELFSNGDWPMAASVAVVAVLLVLVPLALFNHYQGAAREVYR